MAKMCCVQNQRSACSGNKCNQSTHADLQSRKHPHAFAKLFTLEHFVEKKYLHEDTALFDFTKLPNYQN